MNTTPVQLLPADFAHVSAVIFDLDGTLVDTLGDFAVAVNLMLQELSLPPLAAPVVRDMVGKGSEHLVRSVLAAVGPPEPMEHRHNAIVSGAKFDQAWDAYLRHYRQVNGQHAAFFPGARACVEQLRQQGKLLACVTNKPGEFARELLQALGVLDAFECVHGGDAFERKKPDPLPLLNTCKDWGIEPRHVLMVGDSSNDAQAARAAGCPVLLLSHGYNHGEPVQSVDCDGVLENFDALSALFPATAL